MFDESSLKQNTELHEHLWQMTCLSHSALSYFNLPLEYNLVGILFYSADLLPPTYCLQKE